MLVFLQVPTVIFFTDSELGRAGRRQSQVLKGAVDSSLCVKAALLTRSKYLTGMILRWGDEGPTIQNRQWNVFLALGFPTHRDEGDSDLEEIHKKGSVVKL